MCFTIVIKNKSLLKKFNILDNFIPLYKYQQKQIFKHFILKAEKDFYVYKRLKVCVSNKEKTILESPFKYYQYILGYHYTLTGKDSFTYEVNNYYNVIRLDIEQGFHSYYNKQRAFDKSSWTEKIIRCIIPKGSLYFKDFDNKEIVSNQIIIEKIL